MERSFSASAPATKPSTNHSQDLKSHVSLQPEEQSSSNMEASVSQVASHSSSQRTALERAALYEALIKKRKDHIDSSYSPVYRLPPHIIGGLSDIVEKSKQCNCRRSACLKLYCECFSSGIYCSVFCSCVPCNNNGPYSYATLLSHIRKVFFVHEFSYNIAFVFKSHRFVC